MPSDTRRSLPGRPNLAVSSLPANWRFEAIGTLWQIDSAVPLGSAITAAVSDHISAFDRDWSRFRSDSWVSGVQRTGGAHRLPRDAESLFAIYDELDRVTHGAVSPFVGEALETLGYDADYSFVVSGTPAAAPRWGAGLSRENGVLTTNPGVLIDIGAVGKGYLVDGVADILRTHGVASFTIDASGDLLHEDHGEDAGLGPASASSPPLRVALEHPYRPELAIGVVELAGGSLCASATNRRVWGDGLHHVIDGRTGHPTSTVVASWATAPSAARADGAATALFFEHPQRVADEFGCEGIRMFTDGTYERSRGFHGEVF